MATLASGDAAPTRLGASPRRPAASRPRSASGVPYPWLKPGIFVGAMAPLVAVALRSALGRLNANPIAQVENELGLTALVLLLASLACSPARRLFGWTWPMRVRRELGLLAFFYATLHMLVYIFIDRVLDVQAVVEDVVKRPFITVGFLALVLLMPLAITSTPDSIRRLGYRRWVRLHQLAYLAGALAVVHFIWRVKIDVRQPLIYAAVLALLLAARVAFWLRARSTARAATARAATPAGTRAP